MRSYSVVGPCTDGHLPDRREAARPIAAAARAYMWSLAPGAQLDDLHPGQPFRARPQPTGLSAAGGRHRHHADLHDGAGSCSRPEPDSGCSMPAGAARTWRLADELRERIGDRLQMFVDEDGGSAWISPPRSPRWRRGASSMSAALSACWRRPRRPGSRAAVPWSSCASRPSATAGASLPQPFKVNIPRLGLEVDVPQNQTMLDALEAAGVAMISDCRRGECGLCALRHSRGGRDRRPPGRVLQRRGKGRE